MSRLDAFIRRMQAQRACIDFVAAKLDQVAGPVLELGLGNGRTYDHLRVCFPGRDIFVFDRQVAAHPACVPPEIFLRLGDFRSSIPAYLAEARPGAAFIHADIGSGDEAANALLAADLAPALRSILVPGGFLACDQAMAQEGLEQLALPEAQQEGRYHLYRRLG